MFYYACLICDEAVPRPEPIPEWSAVVCDKCHEDMCDIDPNDMKIIVESKSFVKCRKTVIIRNHIIPKLSEDGETIVSQICGNRSVNGFSVSNDRWKQWMEKI